MRKLRLKRREVTLPEIPLVVSGRAGIQSRACLSEKAMRFPDITEVVGVGTVLDALPMSLC